VFTVEVAFMNSSALSDHGCARSKPTRLRKAASWYGEAAVPADYQLVVLYDVCAAMQQAL